ncbi:MAG: tetratricopeptide repeat protein [Magnetococcales bacterium]|nr:tetratricopeptide repeat protein [Magnetococcales bacterium]
MQITSTLTFFVVLGFVSAFGAIFIAWHRVNKRPMEAQDWKRNRAETLWKDAVDLQSKGIFAKALEKWQQSAFMESDSFKPRPGFLGQVHNELGYCYYRLGLFQESEDSFVKSLKFYRKTSFRATFDTAFTLNNYALLCLETGRHDQALAMINRSMRIFTSGLGEHAPQIPHVLNNLARVHLRLGAYNSALTVLQKSLDIVAESLLPNYPESMLAKELLAETYQHLGSIDQAEKLFLEVIATKEALHGSHHPGILPALHSLAKFHLHQGLMDKSLHLHQRILDIILDYYQPEHHFVAEFLHEMACLKIQLNSIAEARAMVDESLAILTKADKTTHPSMLINIYLRLWLTHQDLDWNGQLSLLKQAMVLLQMVEHALLGGVVYHLAALLLDRLKAPDSAIFFGKLAVGVLLNRRQRLTPGHEIPWWLTPPSTQSLWIDLGNMLRREKRGFEAQALVALFPSNRPVVTSVQAKICTYLQTGWQLTEEERRWEQAMGAWQKRINLVLYPTNDAAKQTNGQENKSEGGKSTKKGPPPQKPSEIMKNAQLMAPILAELDQLFAMFVRWPSESVKKKAI